MRPPTPLRRSAASTISLATLFFACGANPGALADDRDNCLYCHQFPGLSRLEPSSNAIRLFYIDPAYTHSASGPHARLACTDCHPRDEVAVIPHRPVSPVDCARQCHLVRPDAPERRFSHANVAELLARSVHTPDVLGKLQFARGPLLNAGQSICLYCHDEPVFRVQPDGDPIALELATARCDTCHGTQVPLDTDYLLQHVGARLQPARPPLELAQVCSVCHSDPAVLAATRKSDPVASYVRSFHGKAALLGDQTTAGCVDCHAGVGQNAHLMLGFRDARSSVHPTHLAESCLRCHATAAVGIASTAVHLDLSTARDTIDFLIALAFILITVISFVPSALIVILELAQLVIVRHAHTAVPVQRALERILQHPDGPRRLTRFRPSQRVQHWVLTLLFILLVLTGFPMKFANQQWAAVVIGWFGSLATARVVHHWAGVALVVGFALHLFAALGHAFRAAPTAAVAGRSPGLLRRILRLPMVMSPADLRKLGQLMAYLVGLRRERPRFGRFSASEKFEYFGVLWGTTLLGITGFMLWRADLTSHLFGGRVFNIATIIHTYEAFLAVIHVGILHICNVVLAPHVFPLSLATLTGRTPAAKLADENGEFVLDVARELGVADVAGPPEASHA